MKKGTKLASLLIGLALIIPACNQPANSSTPTDSSKEPESSETSAQESSSQEAGTSSKEEASSSEAASSSQASSSSEAASSSQASSSSEAASSSEAPVNYEVSITNKEALQAEWFVGDQGRKVDISTNPRANISVLINEGKIQITSSDTNVVTISGQMATPVGAGEATIKVKCGDSEDTVKVTLQAKQSIKEKYGVNHEGTAEDPLDNEDAIKIAKDKNYNNEDLYIKGVISSFYHAPGARTDGAVSWYLTPAAGKTEKFEVYKCYKANGDSLTDDDVWVNGTAIAHGTLTTYGEQAETSSAKFVSCEGNKPQERKTYTKTFAEVLALGQALPDGGDSYDYYKFQGFVTAKEGNNFFLTATKGEALISGKSDADHGTRDIYTNAIELYDSAKVAEINAICLEGAKVEVTMVVKNYHGTVENLLALTKDDVTLIEAGEAWKVPEPTVTNKTIAEFKALANSKALAYNVTGQVKDWGGADAEKSKYGNMTLTDGEGNELTVYGASATATALVWDNASSYAFTNPKDFLTNEQTAALNIGDTVTMKMIRADYNGAIQGTGVITKIVPGGTPVPQVVSLAKYEFESVDATNTRSIDAAKATQLFKKASGEAIFSEVTAVENVYESASGGSGDNTFAISNVLKIGKSKAGGSAAIKLSQPVSKVVLKGDAWLGTTSVAVNDQKIENAFDGHIISKTVIVDNKLTNAGELSFEFEASDTIKIDVANTATSGNFGVVFESVEFFGEQGDTPAEIAQPVGNFSGNAVSAQDGSNIFVDIALSNEKAFIEVGSLLKDTKAFTFNKETGLLTIDLGAYGTLTATYDEENNKLINCGIEGAAAAYLSNNNSIVLNAAANYWNLDGTTDELRAQFIRRWRANGASSWTVDNDESHTDRILSDTTNFVSGTGAMSVRPYSGSGNAVGLSLKNDFAEAKALKNIGFWVYNSSANDIALRTWVFTQTGLSGAAEIGGLTAKANGWTYCRMGFDKTIYNFNISNWNGSSNALVFDDIVLF